METDDLPCSRNVPGFVCLVGWSFWFFWMNFRSDQPDRRDRPDGPAFLNARRCGLTEAILKSKMPTDLIPENGW